MVIVMIRESQCLGYGLDLNQGLNQGNKYEPVRALVRGTAHVGLVPRYRANRSKHMSADIATPIRALSNDEANAVAVVILFVVVVFPCLPVLFSEDEEEEEGAEGSEGGSEALMVSLR